MLIQARVEKPCNAPPSSETRYLAESKLPRPGRHIGDRALEGHEGGALMGGRNGGGDREGGAGAGGAQGHEEGEQQIDGQA